MCGAGLEVEFQTAALDKTQCDDDFLVGRESGAGKYFSSLTGRMISVPSMIWRRSFSWSRVSPISVFYVGFDAYVELHLRGVESGGLNCRLTGSALMISP